MDCLKQEVFLITPDAKTEVPVSPSNTIQSEIQNFIDSIMWRDVSSRSGVIGARTVEALESVRLSMWDRRLPVIEKAQQLSGGFVVDLLQRVKNRRLEQSRFENELDLERYMGILVKSGLLKRVSGETDFPYELTENGSVFMQAYGEVAENGLEAMPVLEVAHEQPTKNDF